MTEQDDYYETKAYNALMGAMLVLLERGSIPHPVGKVTPEGGLFTVDGFTGFANALAPAWNAPDVARSLSEKFLGAGYKRMIHMNFEMAEPGVFRSASLRLARQRWEEEVGRRLPWLIRPHGEWIAGDVHVENDIDDIVSVAWALSPLSKVTDRSARARVIGRRLRPTLRRR